MQAVVCFIPHIFSETTRNSGRLGIYDERKRAMRHIILLALVLIPMHAWAETNFIAPGTPETVGVSGALLGSEPGHSISAPRGTMETFGLFSSKSAQSYGGPRIGRQDAKSRMEHAGFQHVIDLYDDERGGWRARAIKNGSAIDVQCTGMGEVVEG